MFRGIDTGLNRRVAIKTILTKKLDAEAARMVAVRFDREVRAVARLNHRNIVQVYDFGSEGDLAYIVMEFIQGRELKDYFDGTERFDLKSILRLMTELLDALDFAHEAADIGFERILRADGNGKSAVVAALLTERNVKVEAGFHFEALTSAEGRPYRRQNRNQHRSARLFSMEQRTDETRR